MARPLRPTGLGFFGVVIASISHEIKNRLAIINEETLLVKDLAQVSDKELGQDRLVSLADSVKAEIDLADTIIKNMNRFAHSVDELVKKENLYDLINLTASLYKRIAAMKNVTLEVHSPVESVLVNVNSFSFMNLMWLYLNAVIEEVGKKCTIHLGSDKNSDGLSVWLKVESTESDINIIQCEEMKDLADEIGARVSFFPEQKIISIILPADL